MARPKKDDGKGNELNIPNFKEIEEKWQKRWEEDKVFQVKEDSKKNKYYVLEMYPYPSSSGLHMGHAFNYVIGDIISRFKRMQGFNVLHPMGYDSFGLPAENAAIKNNSHPKVFTEDAIANYIRQQRALGLSYDWTRKIQSHDPLYYKWNQHLFLQLYRKGLVYRKEAVVNWCSKCKTVLANEQVQGGKCWRHTETEVEIKNLEQWFIKTTVYAEELLRDLEKLNWPERIKTMQRNWIGRSEGAKIIFKIQEKPWNVFTTRPDTLFGVSFLVISAQHTKLFELVTKDRMKEVEDFVRKIKTIKQEDIDKLDKEGVFTGAYADHPLTGEKIPVWAGNFVLAEYGSGMIMAVPAHDQRDFEFAKKYNIPIKLVIKQSGRDIQDEVMIEAYIGSGELVNSKGYNGLNNEEAKEKIVNALNEKRLGEKSVQYKLRDWLISRQRYWGTPIPIVYCENCKNEIKRKSYELSFYDQDIFFQIATGKKIVETRALNPHEKTKEFYGNIKKGDYIKCINKLTNEIIYLKVLNVRRFNSLQDLFKEKELLERIFPGKYFDSISKLEKSYSHTEDYLDRIKKYGLVAWDVQLIFPGIMPVPEKDLPVLLPEKVKFGEGNPLASCKEFVETRCPKCKGKARRETDTMDTFFDSSWYYLRFTDALNTKEPFNKKKAEYWMPVDFYTGGAEHACMHLIYARFFSKFMRDIGYVKYDEPFPRLFNQGMVHGEDGAVMSKSRGNVIDPLEISKKYGTDALRLFLVSMTSPDKDFAWSSAGIESSFNFVMKLVKYSENVKLGKSSKKLEHKANTAIREVTNNIESLKYNFAIIHLRSLLDSLEDEIAEKDLKSIIKLVAPFCPHIAEELWSNLGNKDFITLERWPEVDESKIDTKIDEQEKAFKKTVDDIFNVLKIVKEKKGKESIKVYLYVLPNENEGYNSEMLSKRIGKEVIVFAVNDKKKYDPEGKAGKAKPGKPGIYAE
ncbi:leucine--tRNA ligase [Candidatus Pacearchaeota archaeon]|nr:leucine--tRNA ligase [Candidatus Pacearchaeota archaeon]